MSLENLKKSINTPATLENIATKSPRARGKSPAEYWGENTVAAAAEEKLARLRREEPALRPVLRTAVRLADLIEASDIAQAKRVISDAMTATHRVYNPISRSFDHVPDHRSRIAAVTLQLAYHEGLPVKREISVQANFESGESVIERIKASPEAMRMLGRMGVQKSPSIFEAEITGEPEPEK
jgi:hypothetical protein